MKQRLVLAAAVVAGILVLDQVTKGLVDQNIPLYTRIPVVPSFFDLTHLRNPGAAFSFLAYAPAWFRQPFFLAATLAAVGVLCVFLWRMKEESDLTVIAVAGILGGAVGNLIDRVRYGEVIDFLLVYWGEYSWPAFNVADSCITLGVIGLLWASLRGPRGEHDPGGSTFA